MKNKIIIVSLLGICLVGSLGCTQPQKFDSKISFNRIEFSQDIKDIPMETSDINYVSDFSMDEVLNKAKTITNHIPIQSDSNEDTVVDNNKNDNEFLEESAIEYYDEEEDVPKVEEYPLQDEPQVTDQSVEYEYDENYNNQNELTQNSGINTHNDRTETYYSSNSLYHQDTDEWEVDDEGFYRTDEGYYVVAASDMPQGTTFEGSKGTCIVLDSGCAEGITDYYVAW